MTGKERFARLCLMGGYDTMMLAQLLDTTEAEVYNLLPQLEGYQRKNKRRAA